MFWSVSVKLTKRSCISPSLCETGRPCVVTGNQPNDTRANVVYRNIAWAWLGVSTQSRLDAGKQHASYRIYTLSFVNLWARRPCKRHAGTTTVTGGCNSHRMFGSKTVIKIWQIEHNEVRRRDLGIFSGQEIGAFDRLALPVCALPSGGNVPCSTKPACC